MSTKSSDNSLNAEGWRVKKSCLVTTDARVSVTSARPDVRPDRTSSRWRRGKLFPTLKETLTKLGVGPHPLRILELVAEITDEFTLGLDGPSHRGVHVDNTDNSYEDVSIQPLRNKWNKQQYPTIH
jgi:hypothetical protein